MKVEREIIPPKNGWKQNTWYIVDISCRPGNPIHESLFYTGFLDNGKPSGYNGLVPANGPDFEDKPLTINQVVYCKAKKELWTP